ncbi:MAG: hypothetical protein P4L99_28110 [Chthoniobacter sp.]|nr:hypothetical protein [Chthoniobacter sp.]
MSAAPEDPSRLEANMRAFLEPDVNQDMVTLLQGVRSFSGATLVMMQWTKNEWLKRLPVAQMESSYFATAAWLYIQAAPENEVREMIWNERMFRSAVMAWMSEDIDGKPRISAATIAAADVIIQHELGLIEAAQVGIEAKPGDKAEAAPPNS